MLLGYGMSGAYGLLMLTDMILLRHFTFLQQRENRPVVIFWMSMIGSSLSVLVSLGMEKQTIPSTLMDWLIVFGHCGTFGIMILLKIFVCSSRLPGVVISLIGSTSIIYMTISQYTFLSNLHPGNHNWLEIAGVCIVLTSSILPSIVKYVQERGEQQKGSGSEAD